MKSGMRRKMVEGTFDQLPDGLFRRQALKIELALLGADFLIYPLKHREVERILVAEIMINELLVDAGTRGDFIHPRAGQPAFRKFAPRRGQQFLSRVDRVAPLRLGAIGSWFWHFQPDS